MTAESIAMHLNLYLETKNSGKGTADTPSKINARCQVDQKDMQCNPDCDTRFIFSVSRFFTKFVLHPSLHNKRADELAHHFWIFSQLLECQKIPHSNNKMKV